MLPLPIEMIRSSVGLENERAMFTGPCHWVLMIFKKVNSNWNGWGNCRGETSRYNTDSRISRNSCKYLLWVAFILGGASTAKVTKGGCLRSFVVADTPEVECKQPEARRCSVSDAESAPGKSS